MACEPNAPNRVPRNRTVRNWQVVGRSPSGPRPGEGEIVARSETRGEVDRNTSFTPGSDTVGEIEPFHCARGRAWRSCGRCNRPPRSFAR